MTAVPPNDSECTAFSAVSTVLHLDAARHLSGTMPPHDDDGNASGIHMSRPGASREPDRAGTSSPHDLPQNVDMLSDEQQFDNFSRKNKTSNRSTNFSRLSTTAPLLPSVLHMVEPYTAPLMSTLFTRIPLIARRTM